MKKFARNGAAVALISPLKRTPRDAEFELAHIESTLRIIARSHFPALPLGPAYWRARVREIRGLYTLFNRMRSDSWSSGERSTLSSRHWPLRLTRPLGRKRRSALVG